MKKNFKDLLELARHLRSPEGCPWDREQSLRTLKSFIVEEAYEVVEAIESGDTDNIVEELGDLLYQIIFASQISSEENKFNINNVINGLHAKLVRRHPHVFGEQKADDAEEALRRWNSEKLKEDNRNKSILDIPRGMPALLRAQRVGEKASAVGFDWNNINDVIEKLEEELRELKAEISYGNEDDIEKEWGDLIFSVVNLARHLDIDSETSAHKAINKFINRFSKIETRAAELGKNISELSLKEMDNLWNDVK